VLKLAAWLTSRCLKTMTGTGSEQQQLDRQLWEWLLDERCSRRRKGLCLPDLVLECSSVFVLTHTESQNDIRIASLIQDSLVIIVTAAKWFSSCLYCRPCSHQFWSPSDLGGYSRLMWPGREADSFLSSKCRYSA
jgi:hypothetical protein